MNTIYTWVILITLFASSMAEAKSPSVSSPKPMGDKVAENFKVHIDGLQQLYTKLKSTASVSHPELLTLLSEPPTIQRPGYQLLPKIIASTSRAPSTAEKFYATKFSWVLTGDWIARDQKKVQELNLQLDSPTPPLEEMFSIYKQLDKNQKIINGQIEYNRLWQKEVVLRRPFYDANTKIYNDLVSKKLDPDQAVRLRLEKLMAPPYAFLKLNKLSPQHFEIEVNAITDIEDVVFLNTFQNKIQEFWRAKSDRQYSVKLNLTKINGAELYPDKPAPKRGESIDVRNHVARFPAGYAIITAGSGTSHYSVDGRNAYVVFGPSDTTSSVLAHEFGHILQLNDAYFRGYRDLGAAGFEILEVVPDLTDIMSSPGFGKVKPHHFEILVKALEVRDSTTL